VKDNISDLWTVFWSAVKETPKGMYAPFEAFFRTLSHNPVLCRSEHRHEKSGHAA